MAERISRRDALRVAADVLERSDWLTVDLLADQGDENASENADRVVEILRELAKAEGNVPATVPPPSGATGATTDGPECEDLHTTYAEDGTALVPRDHWGRGCPAEVPVSTGAATYATGGYVGPADGAWIREEIQAATDRAHALPSYARPTVTRPVFNGGQTDAALPGMWERADFLGGAPDVVRTSGPLDPEIHAALVRSVERGRREEAERTRSSP